MQSIILFYLKNEIILSLIILLLLCLTPLTSKIYKATTRYYMWLVLVIVLIIPCHYSFNEISIKLPLPKVIENLLLSTPVSTYTSSSISTSSSDEERVFSNSSNSDLNTLPSSSDDTYFDTPSNAQTNSYSSFSPHASTYTLAPSTALNFLSSRPFNLYHLIALWLIGVIVFSLRLFINYQRFMKSHYKWSVDISDAKMNQLISVLATNYHIDSIVKVKYCKLIISPITTGLFHPLILLPYKNLEDEDLKLLLSHELIHYKRNDALYKLLINIAHVLHWFNPLVYLMKKRIYFECEASCDELVLRNTNPETRFQYGEMMLDFAREQNQYSTILSNAFFGKNALKQRLSMIMDTNLKRSGKLMISILLISTILSNSLFGFETPHVSSLNTPKSLQEFTISTNDSISLNQAPSKDVHNSILQNSSTNYDSNQSSSNNIKYFGYDVYNENYTHWTAGIVEMTDGLNNASVSAQASGRFYVKDETELVLYSTMQSGLFSFDLFSPDGKQVVHINSKEVDKTIKLTPGIWAYNYSINGSHGLAFAVARKSNVPIDIVMNNFELHK